MPHQVSQHDEADRSEEYRNHNIDSELDCVQGPALNRSGWVDDDQLFDVRARLRWQAGGPGSVRFLGIERRFQSPSGVPAIPPARDSLIPYPAPNAIITAISQTTSCIAKL